MYTMKKKSMEYSIIQILVKYYKLLSCSHLEDEKSSCPSCYSVTNIAQQAANIMIHRDFENLQKVKNMKLKPILKNTLIKGALY